MRLHISGKQYGKGEIWDSKESADFADCQRPGDEAAIRALDVDEDVQLRDGVMVRRTS